MRNDIKGVWANRFHEYSQFTWISFIKKDKTSGNRYKQGTKRPIDMTGVEFAN